MDTGVKRIPRQYSARTREWRWLETHWPSYGGLWVALVEDRCVGSASDLKTLLACIKTQALQEPPLIHYVRLER